MSHLKALGTTALILLLTAGLAAAQSMRGMHNPGGNVSMRGPAAPSVNVVAPGSLKFGPSPGILNPSQNIVTAGNVAFLAPTNFLAQGSLIPFTRGFPSWWWRSNNYRTPRFFVVAEKRGPEVIWNMYSWEYQARDRVQQLQTEANAAAQSNAQLGAKLGGFRNAAFALQFLASRADDRAAKEELQANMTRINLQISAERRAMAPVVRWLARGPIDQKGVEGFVRQLEQESGSRHVHQGNLPTQSMGQAQY